MWPFIYDIVYVITYASHAGITGCHILVHVVQLLFICRKRNYFSKKYFADKGSCIYDV